MTFERSSVDFNIIGNSVSELIFVGGAYGGTILEVTTSDYDRYIVTSNFAGPVTINESASTIAVYLDKGVAVTGVTARSLSLDGGGSITFGGTGQVRYHFDGNIYTVSSANVFNEVGGSGGTIDVSSTSRVVNDYVDLAAIESETVAGVTDSDHKTIPAVGSVGSSFISGGIANNSFSFGSSQTTIAGGGGGNDTYRLTGFQRGGGTINDSGGTADILIIEYGVSVIQIVSSSLFNFIGGGEGDSGSRSFTHGGLETIQIGGNDSLTFTVNNFFNNFQATGLPIDLGLSPTLREAWLGDDDIVKVESGEGALVNLSGEIATFTVNNKTVTVNANQANFYSTDESGTVNVLEDDSETVTLDVGAEAFAGSVHSHSVAGTEGNDFIMGNDGNNTLAGGGGDDKITGGSGADTLIGGEGNDTLIGDGGADTLIGGGGDDILTGGLNKDTFTASAGTDTITDFSDADTLHFNRYSDVASLANLTFTASSDNKSLTIAYTGGQVTLQNIENIINATNGNYMTYFGEGGDGNDMITIDHTPIFTGTPNDYQKTIKENDFFSLDLKLTKDGNNPLSFAVADASGLRSDSPKSMDSFISQFKFTNGTLTANGLDRDILSGSDKYGTVTLTITASDTINGGVVSQSVTVTVEGVYDEGAVIENVQLTDGSGNNKPAEKGILILGDDDTYTFTINNNNASFNENQSRSIPIRFTNGDAEDSWQVLESRPHIHNYDRYNQNVTFNISGNDFKHFTQTINKQGEEHDKGYNFIGTTGTFATKPLDIENGVAKERLIATFTLTVQAQDESKTPAQPTGPEQAHVVHWHFNDIDDELSRIDDSKRSVTTNDNGTSVDIGNVTGKQNAVIYTMKISDPDVKTGSNSDGVGNDTFTFTLNDVQNTIGQSHPDYNSLFKVTAITDTLNVGTASETVVVNRAELKYISTTVTSDVSYRVLVQGEEHDSSGEASRATHTITVNLTPNSKAPPQERKFSVQTPIEFDSTLDGLWALDDYSTGEFFADSNTQFIWEDSTDKSNSIDSKEELQFAFETQDEGFNVSLDKGNIILEFASHQCLTINGDGDFTNDDIENFNAFIDAIGEPEFG